jgi:hypothetical protein
LHALGYGTHAPALPSAGERPVAGMHDDARVLAEELASIEGPVVLLGHSYGGIPVTEAAAGAANVARLIYLAAYMPDKGQSMYTIHGLPDPEDISGLFPFNEPRTSFYGDLPDAEAERAVSRLVNQTVRSFAEKVDAAAWRNIVDRVRARRDSAGGGDGDGADNADVRQDLVGGPLAGRGDRAGAGGGTRRAAHLLPAHRLRWRDRRADHLRQLRPGHRPGPDPRHTRARNARLPRRRRCLISLVDARRSSFRTAPNASLYPIIW